MGRLPKKGGLDSLQIFAVFLREVDAQMHTVPKFNNLCKIAFIFLKMPTLWSLEVNKAILEQVKVAEWEVTDNILKQIKLAEEIKEQILKKLKLCTKLFPRHYMKVFTAKFIWNTFYLLFVIFYHLFVIIYRQKYFLNSHWMTG